jgi:hypothetical protein
MAAPVPFGEAIKKGLEAAKPHFVILLVGALITGVLASFLVGILCVPGLHLMALKAVRGQKPELGDLFIGFKEKLVDHLIMVILTGIGGICLGIGALITAPLFYQGTYLLLDKKVNTWGEAKDKCMAEVKPNLVPWIIMVFVVYLPAAVCFLLAPITLCGMAYAYEKGLGGGGGAASAEPAKA